jgi:hypothetical protein
MRLLMQDVVVALFLSLLLDFDLFDERGHKTAALIVAYLIVLQPEGSQVSESIRNLPVNMLGQLFVF